MRYFMGLICAMTLAACGDAGTPAASGSQSSAPTHTPSGEKIYRVITEDMYEPYVMRRSAGQTGGFEYEVLKAVAEREKLNLQFTSVPNLEDLGNAIKNGEADIASSGLTITPERQQFIDFAEPFIETRNAVLVKAANNSIQTMADLKGRNTSMQSGSYQVKLAQNLGATPILEASTWVTVNNIATGKAEAALGDKYVLQYHLGRDSEKSLRLIEDESQEVARLAFGVRKGDSELLAKLNSGLAAIRADGTYDQIYQRWFTNAQASAPAAQ